MPGELVLLWAAGCHRHSWRHMKRRILCFSTHFPLIAFECFCIRTQLCLLYRKQHTFFLNFTSQQRKVQDFEQKCILGHLVSLHYRTWICMDHFVWCHCIALLVALHPLHLHVHRCSPKTCIHAHIQTHVGWSEPGWISSDWMRLDEIEFAWMIADQLASGLIRLLSVRSD